MADGSQQPVRKTENLEKREDYDPRLDFYSDKFDPLLALKSPSLKVPVSDAKRFDNIAMYKSAEDKKQKQLEAGSSTQPTVNSNVIRPFSWRDRRNDDEPIVRRWKEHQMPIPSTYIRKQTDIFQKMEQIQGPLSLLKKCIDEKLRIKVYTRNDRFVRGYCLANLVAFDKFWNMVLINVVECWTRSKKRKVPALDSVDTRGYFARRAKPPPIEVFPHEKNKKLEVCLRRVNQFLLRGEHVVIVHIVEPDDFDKAMNSFDEMRARKHKTTRS